MYQFLRTCLVYLKLKIQEVFAYRVVIVSWSIVFIIPLLVAAGIWFSSPALYPSFGGYSRQEMIAYYFLFFSFTQVFSSYIFFSTMDEIINGKLAFYLLKPFPYFMAKTVNEIGWRAVDFLFRLPIFIAIIVLAHNLLRPGIAGASLVIFVLSLIVGMAIYHLMAFTFGLLAFWFTRIESFHGFYFVIFAFLSGEVIPLHLYPAPWSSVVTILPFRYIFAFPIEVYLGKLTPSQQLFGLTIAFVWFGFFAFFWKRLWHKGLVGYSAYGG